MGELTQVAPGPAPPTGGVEAGPELTRRATAAYGWSVLNTGLSRLGTLAVGIALARLLGPAEFAKLITGSGNPTMMVMTGKVKARGDLSVAMAFQNWFDTPKG